MKFRALLLGLGSALVLAACAQKPVEPQDTSAADAAAIRAAVHAFINAWNKGDMASIGVLLAADAILMEPATPAVTGREAVLETIANGFDPATGQQTETVDEIIVNGDQAYARGTWLLTPTEAAGPDAQAANGKWTVLYKRGADGKWQIWRWMWNQEGGPPAPAADS